MNNDVFFSATIPFEIIKAIKNDDLAGLKAEMPKNFDFRIKRLFVVPNHITTHKHERFSRIDSFLSLACAENALKIVEYLLDSGADPKFWGYPIPINSPLLAATLGGHEECMELLLTRGADVEQKDFDGCTALHVAAMKDNPGPLAKLLSHGADINARDGIFQRTPLMIAAAEGCQRNVLLLISRGADISFKNRENLTALDFSREPNAKGEKPCEFILELAAKSQGMIIPTSETGKTEAAPPESEQDQVVGQVSGQDTGVPSEESSPAVPPEDPQAPEPPVSPDATESPPALNAAKIPTVRVLDRIEPSEDRVTKPILKSFQVLVDEDMALATVPNIEMLASRLDAEFPWFSSITRWLVKKLTARLHGNNVLKLPPLLLLGAPGIGKTSYIQRFSELAETPFTLLNMGGASDNKVLDGVARGWSTGRPSPLLYVILQHQKANPVILLDEIDKAGGSDHNGRPLDTLLTLTEPSSAKSFYDTFLMGSANLSYLNIIACANEHQLLPGPLLSRFEVLRVPEPSPEHYRGIVERCTERFLKENEIHPSWIEPFGPADWKWLSGYYKNPRLVRKAVETLLSHKLSEASVHCGLN